MKKCKKVFIGPIGSGKTSRLKNIYEDLINESQSENILVLLQSASEVSQWRDTLEVSIAGNLNIYTYFGFIQRELTNYWPLIIEKISAGDNYKEPVFMTAEAAHYFMRNIVENIRKQGGFDSVKSTTESIAVQLIDNLNQAALNNITLHEACNRLISLGNESGDRDKIKALQEAVAAMKQFRKECHDSQCLDYSLTVEIYNRYLFTDSGYLKKLKAKWKYLIVDNLEETVPVAQDLILKLLEFTEGAFFAFDPEGGHTIFFGAYPEGVQKNIIPKCEVEKIEWRGNKNIRLFSKNLANFITGRSSKSDVPTLIIKHIKTDLRGVMLKEVVAEIEALVSSGTRPGEIAIISPVIDKVMEYEVSNKLKERNINSWILNRTKKLNHQSYALALITLVVLVNPNLNIVLDFSTLLRFFCLVLEMDPVRASLIAECTLKNNSELPHIDDVGLREKVGFSNSEKYQELREWVNKYRNSELDLELLLQRAFAELLAPLLPCEEDILACKQLIDSAIKFRKASSRYSSGKDEMSLEYAFTDMIKRGTIAADTLYLPAFDKDKVIMSAPVSFLMNPYIKSVQYQFWMDVGGSQWLRSIAKEFTNPWVLSRRWSGKNNWDDILDQSIRVSNLARIVNGLVLKCTGGIYVANSFINSHGWEQQSIFSEVLDRVVVEEVEK